VLFSSFANFATSRAGGERKEKPGRSESTILFLFSPPHVVPLGRVEKKKKRKEGTTYKKNKEGRPELSYFFTPHLSRGYSSESSKGREKEKKKKTRERKRKKGDEKRLVLLSLIRQGEEKKRG